MNKFGIVAKKDDISNGVENRIKERLLQNGWCEDKIHPELVICVGGDGTLLHAVHKYMDLIEECSFIAIHTGTLGFFTDYTVEEEEMCLNDILNKEAHIREMDLLEIDWNGQQFYAVNEMRIENVVRTQLLNVKIDGEYFETFRGTGMCVCTQAGSTAYNRSLRGAVVEEGLSLLQMHEITGIHHHKYHSLGVPYIMKPERTIEFDSDNFKDAILCYDQKHIHLNSNHSVKVRRSKKKIRFAEYRTIRYLDRLKDLY